jgi:hypothetical protein
LCKQNYQGHDLGAAHHLARNKLITMTVRRGEHPGDPYCPSVDRSPTLPLALIIGADRCGNAASHGGDTVVR